MAKDKKAPRPRAETPKGFRDHFGADVTERTAMLAKIAEVYHRYGFDALETSAVETVEALGKFLPDVDRPNEGVFAWQEAPESEKPGDWLALRYDMTAPLARVYAQYRNDLPTPYRRYTMGPVWRNEKPGPGRFRQFYQCDADTVGTGSVAADAEICAMLCDVLEAVGIKRGDYVVRVNNRKVLNGLLARVMSSDFVTNDKSNESPDNPFGFNFGQMATASTLNDPNSSLGASISHDDILRTIDKYDKVGAEGVRELMTDGRRDVSGAYVDGLGATPAQAAHVVNFLSSKGETNIETIENLKVATAAWPRGEEGVEELSEISSLLDAQGYGPDRIVIDPSVVRGLGYYTGPVYEAELTFQVEDEKGRSVNFGSVAGGGRYDDLVKRFTGQEVPATGVSVGVDRLLAALRARRGETRQADGPVVVTVMDRDRMAEYQAMASELRTAYLDPDRPEDGKIRAEVYLGNPKNFGNQMKYADKRGSPVAVIAGGDEFAAGTVQIKDLILGAKIAENASLEEWKDRPSQYEVPRADLVARVRAILNGQG